MKVFKTYQPKEAEVKRDWHLIDAKEKVLGRLATEVAKLLVGKNKVWYAQHLDCGDFVVVINAQDVKLTGKKDEQKFYFRHSGYPGGAKVTPVSKVRLEKPAEIIRVSVSGMLPKNRLKAPRLKRLKIFAGTVHPFSEKFKS